MSLATTLPPTSPPSYIMHDKPADSTMAGGGKSSNVSRLKNMFQTNDPPPPRRSPDTKRKRTPEPDRPAKSQRSPESIDPAFQDPQKFYETTNHVQRFQLTRSLFEKMEKQNTTSQYNRSSRSKSPASSSRTISPSPARSPTSPIPNLTSPESRYRAGSVENIIDEQTYNRKYRNPPSAMHDLSRSESDLTRERSGSDTVVTTSIQHPKSLIEQYETKSSTIHSTRPYSRSPSREPEQQQPSVSSSSHYTPLVTSSTSSLPASSNNTTTTTTHSSGSSDYNPYRSRYSQQYGRPVREPSPDTTQNNRPTSTSSDRDSDIVERWRNRYNRDKHMPSSTTSSKDRNSTTASSDNSHSGLLWKRRSQEESTITKEEIEQSLADADKYFSRMSGSSTGGEIDMIDTRMNESTYSSGSGEEMARSESGHDLATTPESPTTPTNDYNWASSYGHANLRDLAKPAVPSSKPDLPPKPSSEPPSYSASMRGYADMINDDLDADYVDITAATTTPTSKKPPTPLDSLSKKKSRNDTSQSSVSTSFLDADDDDDGPAVPRREDGDGHESKEEPGVPDGQEESSSGGMQTVNQIWDQYFNYSTMHHARYEPVDGKVHMLQDGNFFYEVQGLPEIDPDADLFPTAHKANRIRFNTQPIKVYSTYSVEEYDRKNEDVDPMAASAEYELEKRVERMDLFEVELNKGSDGLGLSIIGMGVGADAGLEKLGIFIKTLTEGGAAERDGRIQVNDQIIEVDGKSLVGVTQAYAASVLRNTSGLVKFLIGREKDPSKSEVARLIQQSLEQDRRREEQKRMQEAAASVLHSPPDTQPSQATPVPPLPASPPPMSPPKSPTEGDLLDSRAQDEDTEEEGDDEDEDMGTADPNIEVFDLPDESSSEAVTPDMDSQVLFIKLKEAQYKNAVSEAELAKLKAKMILLENAESQKKHYEKKCEDMAGRLRETEKSLNNAHKQLAGYQDALEGTKNMSNHKEQRMQEDYATLEKKYHKAKKLIKEYQTRENELLADREARIQQHTEKEQQYNQLVKSMKDRIFQLERDLGEALKAAGLPPVIPQEPHPRDLVIPQQSAPAMKIKPVAGTENLSEVSESESDSPEMSPDKEDSLDRLQTQHKQRIQQQIQQQTKKTPPRPVLNGKSSEVVLNAVPATPLLDTSASKTKAHLANSGALAARRPPSRRASGASQEELETPDGNEDDENEDEPFFGHDSDSTIKKGTSLSMVNNSPPSYAPPPPPGASPDSDEEEEEDDDVTTSSSSSSYRYAKNRDSFPQVNTQLPVVGKPSYLYSKYQQEQNVPVPVEKSSVDEVDLHKQDSDEDEKEKGVIDKMKERRQERIDKREENKEIKNREKELKDLEKQAEKERKELEKKAAEQIKREEKEILEKQKQEEKERKEREKQEEKERKEREKQEERERKEKEEQAEIERKEREKQEEKDRKEREKQEENKRKEHVKQEKDKSEEEFRESQQQEMIERMSDKERKEYEKQIEKQRKQEEKDRKEREKQAEKERKEREKQAEKERKEIEKQAAKEKKEREKQEAKERKELEKQAKTTAKRNSKDNESLKSRESTTSERQSQAESVNSEDSDAEKKGLFGKMKERRQERVEKRQEKQVQKTLEKEQKAAEKEAQKGNGIQLDENQVKDIEKGEKQIEKERQEEHMQRNSQAKMKTNDINVVVIATQQSKMVPNEVSEGFPVDQNSMETQEVSSKEQVELCSVSPLYANVDIKHDIIEDMQKAGNSDYDDGDIWMGGDNAGALPKNTNVVAISKSDDLWDDSIEEDANNQSRYVYKKHSGQFDNIVRNLGEYEAKKANQDEIWDVPMPKRKSSDSSIASDSTLGSHGRQHDRPLEEEIMQTLEERRQQYEERPVDVGDTHQYKVVPRVSMLNQQEQGQLHNMANIEAVDSNSGLSRKEAEKAIKEQEKRAKEETKERARLEKEVLKGTKKKTDSFSGSTTSLSKKEEKERKEREKREKKETKERERRFKAEAKEREKREKAERKLREKQIKEEAKKAGKKAKKERSVSDVNPPQQQNIRVDRSASSASSPVYANDDLSQRRAELLAARGSIVSTAARTLSPEDDVWNDQYNNKKQPLLRDIAQSQQIQVQKSENVPEEARLQGQVLPYAEAQARKVIEEAKKEAGIIVQQQSLAENQASPKNVVQTSEGYEVNSQNQHNVMQTMNDVNNNLTKHDDSSESSDGDDQSDTSSLSQASYDPNAASASGLGNSDLIPTSIDMDQNSSGIMLVSSKPRSDVMRSYGSAPSIGSGSSSGGIQLKSIKRLGDGGSSNSSSGGITLLSSRSIDTGFGGGKVYAASTNHLPDRSVIGDHEHESRSQSYDIASATLTVSNEDFGSSISQIPVPDWSCEQVGQWLSAIGLPGYVPTFSQRGVDGRELLTMESSKLKALGVSNSKDRDLIRKKVKDMRTAIERERKQREKEQKAREKLEKQANSKKKTGGLFGKS